jgi:membrane protein YdbS with pleckstrin-like domain
MKEKITLGDFKKEPKKMHPTHKIQWLYYIIPSIIVVCIIFAAVLVGMIKMIGLWWGILSTVIIFLVAALLLLSIGAGIAEKELKKYEDESLPY